MLTKQKLQYHIKHLQEQHRELDHTIQEMDHHGTEASVQQTEYQNLKKKKLRLKDEIELCTRHLALL